MDVQAIVEKDASREKIELRGAMPLGVLFAVFDSQNGPADYISPEHNDIEYLLNELVEYIHTNDDHPLIMATIVYCHIVTNHPFENGNLC